MTKYDDLVEQLRRCHEANGFGVCRKAADAIGALQAELNIAEADSFYRKSLIENALEDLLLVTGRLECGREP